MNHATVPTRLALRRRALESSMLALGLSALLLAGSALAQPIDDAEAFDAVVAAYERSHWREAYDAASRLAERGHAPAARLALRMWRFGTRLYGESFDAAPETVIRWIVLAQGSDAVAARP